MANELKYIIKITDATRYEYYIGEGGSYQFQGEKYAVVVERAYDAKKYKSYNIARNAYEKLFQSCCNVAGCVQIIGIDEKRDLHFICQPSPTIPKKKQSKPLQGLGTGEQTMKLEREQIVKALEFCASPTQMCKDCPMPEEAKDDCRCMETISKNALSLIRELTEENERCKAENVLLENGLEISLHQQKQIEADTVRKMQERLKGAFNFGHTMLEKTICNIIDQIAEDLTKAT